MKLIIDQKLKERLVGMGVLFFLGVIVIPWVLDGERPDTMSANNGKTELSLPGPEGLKTHDINLQDGSIKVVNMQMPERKTDTTEESAISTPAKASLEESTSSSKQALVTTKQASEKPKTHETKQVEPTLKSDSDLNVATAVKPQTQSKIPENIKSATVKSQAPGIESSKQDVAERAMREQVKTDPVSAWTVQLGSFGDKANAERLVEQLSSKDFPAFVNRYQNDAGRVLYRVRVGTEKDRARADKLQASLAKSGFKGKVLTHP